MGLVEGKVAIVTGAGANIGEACAKMLAAQGASVVVADINLAGAERVADEIAAAGGTAMAHMVDLGDEASIAAMVAAVVERYGRIDVLHNNAANTGAGQMMKDGSLTAMEAEVWDAAFDINTRGTMLMTKHVAPHMIASGGGSIINTSSGVSILGDVLNPAYSSSKAAINALTRNTAAQFGRANIRCNAILPGLVLSPVARAQMTEAQLGMIQRHVLLPRESVADDIAGAVLWLASDLGSFITGQIISVDGGICHHQPHYADMLDMMAAMQG
ncbi:SDR family NAD(P)-dependent oxidoreductase [Novosphingobium sp.]|uniref:SDR family NAD(P)-dependent oxidoreductase n=1 Tax=Novosphingobium sp. TaxID=1874826 RepID=UPI0022230F6D|nr:SDR family oxidoreductase [Novosphingobium sp.]MCW1402491.1 SDR family oxidoreductase [Novosphingobium sp. MW5]